MSERSLKIGIDAQARTEGEFGKAKADLQSVGAAAKDTGAEFDRLTATQNRLAKAQYDAQAATRALAEAQGELAANTDPEQQTELEGAVLAARVALDEERVEVVRLTGALEEMQSESEEAMNAMSESSAGMRLSLTDLNSAVQLVERGIGYVRAGIEQTVGVTVEYAAQVRDLSQSLGIQAEEASVLIQMADDLKIGQGALETAFKSALREGMLPNVAGLKDLAAEYQAFSDPTERAQFALKMFGREGMEMQKILELSGEAIDDLARSAKESGLVMSGEAVQAARDYEIALDELSDSVTGLKVKVGNELIPPLTGLASTLGLLATWNDRVTVALEEHEGQVLRTAASYQGYLAEVERARTAAGRGNQVLDDYGNVLGFVADMTGVASEATWRATQLAEQYGPKVDEAGRALARYGRDHSAAAEEVSNLGERMRTLQSVMAGDLGRANDDYYQQQKDLGAQIADTQAKIEDLIAHGYSPAGQSVMEQKDRLAGLQEQYQSNANEHELATRRILFNMIEQQLAADGLNDAEGRALAEIAQKWGLLDEDTARALEDIQTKIRMFNESGDVGQFVGLITGDFNPTVTWHFRTEGTPPSAGDLGLGGDAEVVVAPEGEITVGNRKAAGGAVSAGVAYPWNEPGAAPEILVPAGSGYVLNREQAQEALARAAGGGNAELLAALRTLPDDIARAVRDGVQMAMA